MEETIPRMILKRAQEDPGRTVFMQKIGERYGAIPWSELERQIYRFGKSLLASGVAAGDRVAIMAPNCPNWAYADLGAMAAGAVTVPVYHTEGLEALLHIVNDSGSRLLFLGSVLTARELAEHLEELPELKTIVLLVDGFEHPRFLPLDAFLAQAEQIVDADLQNRLDHARAEATATLVYTSGTTGLPKGAILTHSNILANVRAAVSVFTLGPDDICLSFLPLSHVFERVDGYYLMLHQRAIIAYAEDIDTVPLNLTEVKPTVVISVPRLYEKMFARIMERVLSGPWLKKQLFFGALKIGRAYATKVLANQTPGGLLQVAMGAARRAVFSKLQERLGGRLRFFISGGAPLGREIAEFFLAAGIPIYEGYGLTETAAGIAVNSPGQMRLGSVGLPFPGTDLRIDADGEILVRGPGVFQGYWQRPELTAETFDESWFKTGDIGRLDANGFLTITDRKKDLIITAGGENIAPQNLENLFKSDKYLANALVYGDRKPFLTALLVPNFDNLEKYARYKKIDFLNHCDLVGHPRVLDLLRRRIDRLQENLPPFNRVKRFTLLSRDFSSAEGEVTPTLKLKRKVVAAHFQQVLETMYLPQASGNHDRSFCGGDSDSTIAAK